MFEVQDLKYATLATVSRCGMVWFSDDVVSPEMIINNFLKKLRDIPLEESEEDIRSMQTKVVSETKDVDHISPTLQVTKHVPLVHVHMYLLVFYEDILNYHLSFE